MSQNVESVCQLKIVTSSGDTLICSGTLISKTKILTAHHCMNEGIKKITADCGYIRENKRGKAQFKEKKLTVDPSYKKNKYLPKKMQTDLNSIGFDYAVVNLESESNLEPTPILNDRSKFDALFEDTVIAGKTRRTLKVNSECRITGYGDNNDNRIGTLNTAELLTGKDFIMTAESIGKKPDGTAYYYLKRSDFEKLEDGASLDQMAGLSDSNFTEHGDSGGPLLCKIEGKWTIVGVNSCGGDKFSIFSAVGTEEFSSYLLSQGITLPAMPSSTPASNNSSEDCPDCR